MAGAAIYAAEQKASFDGQLARAMSEQKSSFDDLMASAQSDAADQKASFDEQMAKATSAAGDMKHAFDTLSYSKAEQHALFASQLDMARSNFGEMEVG